MWQQVIIPCRVNQLYLTPWKPHKKWYHLKSPNLTRIVWNVDLLLGTIPTSAGSVLRHPGGPKSWQVGQVPFMLNITSSAKLNEQELSRTISLKWLSPCKRACRWALSGLRLFSHPCNGENAYKSTDKPPWTINESVKPVWIDEELPAIVEGNLLPTILSGAAVDKRHLRTEMRMQPWKVRIQPWRGRCSWLPGWHTQLC